MIGKNVIEIGENEFLGGMTTSPDTTDGGFSPETIAINPNVSPTLTGVLYPPTPLTGKSTPTGSVIASCADPDSGIGVSRYFLTDSGKFYSLSTSYAATLRQSGAKTYVKTTSDMVVYKNKLYATSTLDITEASGAVLGTIDESWWTTTRGKSPLTANPHPIVVFEDAIWIGDGNLLHKWDGTTATQGFLTLPAGQVIVTIGVDSSSGKMLLSISEGINSGGTLPRLAKISTYDGFSAKVTRAVIVDDMVTAIYQLGGTVFMSYGQNLGYWNGSGIRFLTQYTNVTLDTNSLVYKHMITNIGKALMIADGSDVLCFNDFIPEKKKFYVTKHIPTALLNPYMDCIFNLGSNVLGMCYTTTGPVSNFDIWNQATTSGGGSLDFYSKKYKFQRPVQVREIALEYYDSIANNATPAQLYIIDQEKTSIQLPVLTNDTGASTYTRKVKYNGPRKFTTLQVRYENSSHTSVVAGLRRILVYYDVVE